MLVIDKPSGLLVHNSEYTRTREETAVGLVRRAWGDAWAPVHRLDRGTSGALIFARGTDAIRAWQAALTEAEKFYLCLVRGELRAAVDVDHALDDEQGVRRDARSRIEPMWTLPDPRCSLVRVQVFTGRTHQVRRHCAHVSHPVLGDANYGKGALNREYRARFGLARLALHAETLTVTDPRTGTPRTFTSPMPPDLAEPIARIREAAGI